MVAGCPSAPAVRRLPAPLSGARRSSGSRTRLPFRRTIRPRADRQHFAAFGQLDRPHCPSPRGKRKRRAHRRSQPRYGPMCNQPRLQKSDAAITTNPGQGGEDRRCRSCPACVAPSAPPTPQPRPVDGETHRQALDRHVMHHLVIPALQEGRIESRQRGFKPARRHSRAEGDGVLLGDADVRRCARGTGRRRCRGRCQSGIAAVTAHESLGSSSASLIRVCAKDLGVARCVRGCLFFCSLRADVELRGRMAAVGAVFGHSPCPSW